MPVILQKFISREDVQANREVLYLFGDNDTRWGLGGQAKQMRGEPNAVGVRTKFHAAMKECAFWNDGDFATNCRKIDEDLERVERHLRSRGIVIVPLDGVGTGLAELDKRAPLTFEYLQKRLSELIEIR